MQATSTTVQLRCLLGRAALGLWLGTLPLWWACSPPQEPLDPACEAVLVQDPSASPFAGEAIARTPDEDFDEQLERLLAELSGDELGPLTASLLVEESESRYAQRREAWLHRHFQAQRLAAEALAWRLLGLIPEDFDYAEAMLSMAPASAPFFYDDAGHALVLRRGAPLERGLRGAVRELVYALQHRRFGLDDRMDLERPGPLGDDRKLAWMAVIQGDALWAWSELEGFALDPADEAGVEAWLLGLREALEHSETLRGLPAFVRALLLFPELEGFRYIAWERRQDAQWRARRYAALPRSTQQVLHRADSLMPSRLGIDWEACSSDPGRLVYENSLGELGWRAWLEGLGFEASLAKNWAGDRVFAFENEAGTELWLLSRWRSSEAASAVALALQQSWALGEARSVAVRAELVVLRVLDGSPEPIPDEVSVLAAQAESLMGCVRVLEGSW